MYVRHRFKTDPTDYRPVAFPPPGPYWCTGFSGAHSTVIAYLPKGEPLLQWWPDAVDVESEDAEVIVFTDRFACPDWWTPPATDQIRPTTLEGIKKLAKNIGRSRNLQHARALELAACQAGFASFAAARAALAR